MSTPTRMLKPEFLSTHVDINIESYGMLGSAQVSTRTEKLLTANFTAQNQKHFQNLLIVEPLHAVLRIQKKGGNTKCGFDGWWIFGKDIFRATTCEYVCEQAYDGYCTECDDGYEGGSANARTASSTCVTCRAGHYCSAGNSDPCPAGKYSTQQGASSSSTCKSCGNADHHCPSGSQQVRGRATLPGSYAFKCKNGIDCEDSTICPEGFYCYAGEKYSCPAGR